MNLHFSYHQRHLRRVSVLALVLGGLVLLLLVSTLIVGGSPTVSELVTAVGTPTLSAEAFCAEWFKAELKLPPPKRDVAQAEYEDCVEARKSTASVSERLSAVRPGPKNSPPPTRPPWMAPAEVPHRALGDGTAVEEGSSMFSSQYLIENQWWKTVGDQWIRVYAGAQRSDGANNLPKPWQGILFVSPATLDGTFLPGGGMYKTPKKVGSVKIVDGQGARLVLKAEDGTLFYFDVPTRQFVSSLTAPITPVKPTVPPYP